MFPFLCLRVLHIPGVSPDVCHLSVFPSVCLPPFYLFCIFWKHYEKFSISFNQFRSLGLKKGFVTIFFA
uniref:Putative secreted peptide n=1 Tax=Anopheles braziliensis TaxID=58242 RepID=A0A2M3ZNF6_9DIPT